MKRIFNEETINKIGKEVKVAGWVQTIRSHGKIIFIDLRDKSSLLQIVFSPSQQESYKMAQNLKPEWVVEIVGEVKERPKNMANPKIKTGQVELIAKRLKIFSEAKTLPFPIDKDGYEIAEEKRLRYRYLDLRRERLKKNLEIRNKVIQFIREFLNKEGFLEVETPILSKSTPEGARDFLVPARLEPGKFYALPQSPQQYKQLLQVAGIERYFQIARVFRDEDPRADRQAEHTQVDIEMSFVSQEEIIELVENLFKELVRKLFPDRKITKIPFIRMTFQEAMKQYKSDRPDLRRDKNNPHELAFAFITDFPMFEWHQEQKKWGAMHHPFTLPQTTDISQIKKEPEKILAYQYDFVLNGFEVGGGSLRTTNLEVLTAVFEVLGHKKKEIREKFSNYFEAFSFGVPPHGGIAIGLDRLLATILNEPNIREVIAFPKTGDNRDLMMQAPSEVSPEQLKELHIKIMKQKDTIRQDD
jgi:aspartyl-tRNA synthetase